MWLHGKVCGVFGTQDRYYWVAHYHPEDGSHQPGTSVHDPALAMKMAGDASAYGIGAVISHVSTILGPKNGIPLHICRGGLFSYLPTHTIFSSNLPGSMPTLTGCLNCLLAISFTIGQVMALRVTAESVRVATRQDPMLSRVHQFSRAGWPARIPDGNQPYWNHQQELSTEGGCLMWGIE